MKKSIIFKIIMISAVLQLSSCSKEQKKYKKEKIVNQEQVSDTVFDSKNPYYLFIQKNNPEVLNDKVSFFQKSDLDLDGQDEIILAFERDSDAGPFVENFFVLKNENGIIKEIKNDFDIKNYSYSDMQLISLKGESKPYIKVETFDGPYAFGFAIYGMINNEIKQILISPSVGKNYREYDDSLVDSKKDGQFDSYIQNISYQNLTVQNTFSLENAISKLKKSDYIFEGYPEDIESLIKHYMSIRSINFSNKKLNERLQELCLDQNTNETFLNRETWSLFYDNSVTDISPFQIDINEDEATAVTSLDFSYLKKNINQLQFKLYRSNNKWQIINIEVIK